ncbi:MAG: SH3 domain-containing protein [Chloroflexota bacterium]
MFVRQGALRRGAVFVGFCLCLLALISPGFAQGGSAPIQIGQNATGTLTSDAPTAQFALTVNGGETVLIQVLAISQGFAPNFQVLNPAGIEILRVSNPDAKPILTGNAALNAAGVYTIVIGGENGSTGQFVLSLQEGVALPAPTALVVNQPVTATVGSQSPVLVYRFDTTSLGAVALRVISQTPNGGALVTLYDESAGRTIASSDAGLVGATYLLPASGKAYRVTVQASGAGDTAFTICIGMCGGSTTPATTAETLATAPPQSAASPVPAGNTSDTTCTASSSAGGTANLRSGPGTVYAILSGLPLGQTAQVIAVWTGGGWYEVNFNGQTLWVGGSVVALSGDCTTLPRVAAPANAPLAPTPTPTITPTPMASNTPTPSPTPTDAPVPDLPDLAVQGMTITQDSPTHARVTFDVYNRGTVDVTQPFYVYVCITALCVEKQVTLAVRAGSATNVFVDLNHPSSNVAETVAVAVDSRGDIREISEDNNVTSLSDVSLSF